VKTSLGSPSLRGAFVQTLQAKAVLNVAKENLAYYDHVLDISRDRFQAGDIASPIEFVHAGKPT
jgi:hypothetical protein